jgi:hypothetical protein
VLEDAYARRNAERPFTGQRFFVTEEFKAEDISKEKEKYLLELIRVRCRN